MLHRAPVGYEPQLEAILDRLAMQAEEIATLATEAARAEATYKSAYAKARLRYRTELSTIKPTEPYLADLADTATEDLRLRSTIATARLQAARDALRATQAQLDGLRTLAVGQRAAGG